MRYIILCLLILLSPFTTDAESVLGEFPVCIVNNQLVTYYPVSSEFLQELNVSVAVATLYPDTLEPIVLYDVELMAQMPAEFNTYVLYHECAHHKLKHVSLKIMTGYSNQKATNAEQEADCYAAQQIAKKHFTNQQVKIIEDVLLTFGTGAKFIAANNSKKYGTLDERIHTLKTCYDKEKVPSL